METKLIEEISKKTNACSNEILDFLQRLIRFNTCNPPGNEEDMQTYLAKWLRDHGFEVDQWYVKEKRPNVVGVWDGESEGKSLILNGHADTVTVQKSEMWRHPPFSGMVEGRMVYGRGACDMKGGLTAAVMAPHVIRESGHEIEGRVILESVVCEEEGGYGTVEAIKRGYKADAAIVTEPSNLVVSPVQGGSLWVRIEVEGLSAHTGHRWSGIHPSGFKDCVSAIEKGVKLLNGLFEFERTRALAKSHPMFPPGWTTFSPNVIRTTESPFMIPDYFSADALCWYLPDEKSEDVKREIEQYVRSISSTDEWLRDHPPKLDWIVDFEPAVTETDHPIVQSLSWAHQKITGESPRISAFEAASDMKFLTNDAKIPSVIYGPGDIRYAHCINEQVPLNQVITATKVLALAILDWCGNSNR